MEGQSPKKETSLENEENVYSLSDSPEQTQTDGKEKPVKPPSQNRKKSPDNDHGNRFQSKLLFLFFIRAINKKYKFNLATELEEYGGKFDDLVFAKDYGQSVQSFMYLQAKHKQHERKKISVADLLNGNNDNFSLTKYFHSYRNNVKIAEGGPQPGDSVDCVICTNIDFDKENLIKNGIQLVTLSQNQLNDLPREMLTFQPIKRSVTDVGERKLVEKTNDPQKYYQVAIFLLQCATNPNYDPIKYSKYIQHYKEIQDTLLVLSKYIIDPNSITGDGKMGFSKDFIDGVGLSKEASTLRSKIDEKASRKEVNWTEFKFKFDPINLSQKIPTCYRLEPIRWLEIHYVANLLLD